MKKQLLALLLALIMLWMPAFASCADESADPKDNNVAEGDGETEGEEKETYQYVPKPDYLYELSKDLEDDGGFAKLDKNAEFSPDKILVGISLDTRKLQLKPEHFSTPTFDAVAAIESVENLGCNIIVLNLKEPSRENVFYIISELEKIKIISYADPNYSFTLDDPPPGWYLEPVEGLDFNDEVFRILVPHDERYSGVYAEEGVVSKDFAFRYSQNGYDIMQDAAYERALAVNNLYHTDIQAVMSKGNIVDEVMADIDGQLGTYNLILCGVDTIGTLALNHYLSDLTAFDQEEIHLDAPWYNQNFVRNMSIGGRLFYVIGDFSVLDNDKISVLQYNKTLWEQYGLDDPYQKVFDGTWTIDVLHEACKGRAKDVDKSGTIDQYDSFGFVMDYTDIGTLMQGGGCFYAEKDRENDLPYLSLDTPRTHQMLDALLALQNDKTASGDMGGFNKYASVPNVYEYCNKMFMEDRILVRLTDIYRVTQTSVMNSDFGLLPVPKFDVAQPEYYHAYASDAPAVAIPSYVERGNLKDHAAVLEALSYYGREILLETYYEVILKGRILRDENTRTILDIIFDSSYFDIGLCNDFGNISTVFDGSVQKGKNTFAVDYDAIKAAVESDMAAYVDAWEKYEK